MLIVYNHRTSQSAIKKATSILENIDRTNAHKSVNSRELFLIHQLIKRIIKIELRGFNDFIRPLQPLFLVI